MAAGDVRVEGGARFRKTLRAAGDDLSDLKAVHKEVASIVAAAATILAPFGEDTPHLRKTIRGAGTKTAAIARAGNNTNVRYAGPIHYGWHRRHIKPNPFLIKGMYVTQKRWIAVYVNYVEKAINQIEGI